MDENCSGKKLLIMFRHVSTTRALSSVRYQAEVHVACLCLDQLTKLCTGLTILACKSYCATLHN